MGWKLRSLTEESVTSVRALLRAGEATKSWMRAGSIFSWFYRRTHAHRPYCRPTSIFRPYLPHGTTALMASCDELRRSSAIVCEAFSRRSGAHPLRVFASFQWSAAGSLLWQTATITQPESRHSQDRAFSGSGDCFVLRLIRLDDEILERSRWHGAAANHPWPYAGAKDQNLCRGRSGISSCHDRFGGGRAERLRLGYWTCCARARFARI